MMGRKLYLAALVLAASFPLAWGNASAQTVGALYTPPAEQNISGIWWTTVYSPALALADGTTISLTPEGQARYDENQAALEADPLSDEARKFCNPDGVPRILGNPYPFEIIQTPGYVTIIYELNRVVRRIALDVPLPDESTLAYFPYYSGHFVGHWEGDTLIVETGGFNDKTFLDATGLPHSNALRTVERYRKRDDGMLEIDMTASDPNIFTAPLNAQYLYSFHPGTRIEDYTCGKPHRDIAHIPGVAAVAGSTGP